MDTSKTKLVKKEKYISVIENEPPLMLSNEDFRSASSMNVVSNVIISLHSVLTLTMKTSTNPEIIAEFERSVKLFLSFLTLFDNEAIKKWQSSSKFYGLVDMVYLMKEMGSICRYLWEGVSLFYERSITFHLIIFNSI